MCPEAVLKVGGEAYITLCGNGNALKKIDILHDRPPSPKASEDTLRSAKTSTNRNGKSGLPPEALLERRESGLPPEAPRAKGGGADGTV